LCSLKLASALDNLKGSTASPASGNPYALRAFPSFTTAELVLKVRQFARGTPHNPVSGLLRTHLPSIFTETFETS
jgi:hypothetical protein